MANVILTKAFDVRNGTNGLTDATTQYPNAVLILFKDAASQTAAIDALCDIGNWAALPAGQISKGAFALREIQLWLKDKVVQSRTKTEQAKVIVPDVTDLP